MTDVSSSGLRRPDNGATIASGAATARQHANSLQTGTFPLLVTTTAANFYVAFPTPFATAPRVLCTVIDTATPASGHRVDRWGSASGANGGDGTTVGFWFQSARNTGSANIRVVWMAVGEGTEVGG